MTVLIAGILIAGAIMTIESNPKVLPNDGGPGSMDRYYIRYSMTGFSTDARFSDDLEYNVQGSKDSGISYSWNPASVREEWRDFELFWDGDYYTGMWVCNEVILTPLGEKCVRTIYHYDPNNEEMIIMNVGVDSSIVYRETVVSVSNTHRYTINLTATNSIGLEGADKVMRAAKINQPVPVTDTPRVFIIHSEEKVLGHGLVLAEEGQRFRYTVTGGNTSVLVLSLADFKGIEDSGSFRCNTSLSHRAGSPAEVNVPVEAGIYWFIVDHRDGEVSTYW